MQEALPLKAYEGSLPVAQELAQMIGLRYEDNVLTLRFMTDGVNWGNPARQIKLDRVLAEQLLRLLSAELEDYS